MPILLVLIAALTGGGHDCRHAAGSWDCDAMLYLLDDSPGVPQLKDLRHIADVTPSPDVTAQSDTDTPAISEPPAPDTRPETPTNSPAPVSLATPVEGWAVQIAAFGDRDAAELGAQRIGIDSVNIVPTRRDGEDWYVLLLGIYPSREQAEQAGLGYAEESGGSYWVRNAAALPRPGTN